MQEAASLASFGSWEHLAARFREASSSPYMIDTQR